MEIIFCIFLFKDVAFQIELPDEYVYYFELYLVQKEEDGDNSNKYPLDSDSSSMYI